MTIMRFRACTVKNIFRADVHMEELVRLFWEYLGLLPEHMWDPNRTSYELVNPSVYCTWGKDPIVTKGKVEVRFHSPSGTELSIYKQMGKDDIEFTMLGEHSPATKMLWGRWEAYLEDFGIHIVLE